MSSRFIFFLLFWFNFIVKHKDSLIRFLLNDKEIMTNQPPGMVLLDFIRYHEHLTGTKIGCREGDCGACTILVGDLQNGSLKYESVTSCLMPLGNAQGKHIVTIEGINFQNELNPVQKAMADEGATQCGFCTPGFVMSLAGFCLSDKEASHQNAIAAVDGNICRCTGYKSIERACGHVAKLLHERNHEAPALFAAQKKILPGYFGEIKSRLEGIKKSGGNNVPAPDNISPAYFIGGGTDLYVQKHDEMREAASAFLFDLPDLKEILIKGNQCLIGPSATVSDLLNSPVINKAFPDFPRYAKLVSSTPIRNMATLAGNFVNASPIGDFTIFFLAINAFIELSDGKQKRVMALRDFYKGYKQLDKQPDEIISKIWFELPDKNTYFNFEKVSKRTHLDIASVNSAISLTVKNNKIENAGLSAGGVAPVPLFLKKTSEFMKGKSISGNLIEEIIESAQSEISPISDARGSKEYKRLLLGQLIQAHFSILFPETK
jgi:xanthine dehydrogenase small subunit